MRVDSRLTPPLSSSVFQLIAPLIDTKRLAVRYKTTLVLSLLQALGFSTMLVVWYRAKTFAAMDTVPLYDWSTPGFGASLVVRDSETGLTRIFVTFTQQLQLGYL